MNCVSISDVPTSIYNHLSPKTIAAARNDLCYQIRSLLLQAGSVEVTTPILCPHPDVAPIQQFITAHPRTGIRGCLRIAPTEYLKCLLLQGLENVFEFATNFRPESKDATHLVEFTSLEVMTVGATCFDMRNLVDKLCRLILQTDSISMRSPSTLDRNGPVTEYTPPGAEKPYQLDTTWPLILLNEILRDEYGFVEEDFFKFNVVLDLHDALVGGHKPATMAEAMDGVVTAIAKAQDTPAYIGGYPQYLGGPAAPLPDAPVKSLGFGSRLRCRNRYYSYLVALL